MEKAGKTRSDLCRELDFNYTTVTEWYHGRKIPRIDKIEILARYFNIPKSHLLEEEKGWDVSDSIKNMSDEEAQFVLFYLQLSDEEKDKIKQLAEISGIGKK